MASLPSSSSQSRFEGSVASSYSGPNKKEADFNSMGVDFENKLSHQENYDYIGKLMFGQTIKKQDSKPINKQQNR